MTHSSSQLPFPFEERRSFAREDFVPGATNEAALAFVDAWPQWPQRVCALWGARGSGNHRTYANQSRDRASASTSHR